MEVEDSRKENMQRVNRFLTELTKSHSPVNLEMRAENAFGVAAKFLELLTKAVDDEEERRKLMSAWFKAVRDNDYKKFKRALRRYTRNQSGLPADPED